MENSRFGTTPSGAKTAPARPARLWLRLCLISLLIAVIVPHATARNYAGPDDSWQDVIADVLAHGAQSRLPRRALDGFALGSVPIAVREVFRVNGNDERAIAVGEINGETNVFLFHISDAEVVLLRIPGHGTTAEGVYAQVHSGFRAMTDDDTASQLRLEQDFWLNWVAANSRPSSDSPESEKR